MPDLEGATVGLRERKKAKTRAAIQTEALRLFGVQGYDATRVQQIIDEVEVSESTFFRYFRTKADVVLTDEFDPIIVAAFRTQPPGLSAVQALRGAFRSSLAQLSPEDHAAQRDRMALVVSVPELRAAMLDQYAAAMMLLSDVVAERVGRAADDPLVRTLAGAVIGVSMAAVLAIADDPTADLWSLLDTALAQLEEGFSL